MPSAAAGEASRGPFAGLRRAANRTIAAGTAVLRPVLFRSRGDQRVNPSTSITRDQRHGFSETSRIALTVIAAMRACVPQLARSCPSAITVGLHALSPSKGSETLAHGGQSRRAHAPSGDGLSGVRHRWHSGKP
jgi:hypothetical protein